MNKIPEVRPAPHFVRTDLLERSAIKGLYSQDITQYHKVTKFTIQKYLEACLHPEGQFRKFFEHFAKFTGQYNVNEAISDDPQVRSIQISRFFSRMRESPPQIFIKTGGHEYKPASLGSLTEGWNTRTKDGVQIVRIMDVVPIPVEIICAATDQQTLEDLEAIVCAAFGQFQRFTCNYVLKPNKVEQGIYWEVRIPLGNVKGTQSNSPLHNDPQNQLWQSSTSMTVDFENSTYIQYVAAPLASYERGTIGLNLPDQIPLTRQTRFGVHHTPFPVSVYSDDSRVAVIVPDGTSYSIRPKRLGKFKVLVVRQAGATGKPIPGTTNILAEKEVSVVIR